MWWIAARVAVAAPETCNEVDDDGDGQIDEAPVAWYSDSDGDGAGDPAALAFTADCLTPPPYSVAVAGDCDDLDENVSPAEAEGNAPNAVDDDCDGLIDDLDSPPAALALERDADSTFVSDTHSKNWSGAGSACEGWGYHLAQIDDLEENTLLSDLLTSDPLSTWWIGLSEGATGFVWADGTTPTWESWAQDEPTEDGDVNDCGVINEGTGDWFDVVCTDGHPFVCELDCVPVVTYRDADDDGLGDPTTAEPSCALAAGRAYNGEDCDDTNPAVTMRLWYQDLDDDGIGGDDVAGIGCEPAESALTGDCADDDPWAFPGADERCNGQDDDCDGQVDDDVQHVPWYRDRDGDGFGDSATERVDCVEPGPGWVREGEDCDDDDPEFHPGAPDPSDDGLDQDCSGPGDLADRDPPGPSPDDVGCGCGYTPAPAGGLLLLLPLLLRQRERRGRGAGQRAVLLPQLRLPARERH